MSAFATVASTPTTATASTTSGGNRIVQTFPLQDPILTPEELRAGFNEETVKCLNEAVQLKCTAFKIREPQEQHQVFTNMLVDLLNRLRQQKINRYYYQQRQWHLHEEHVTRQQQQQAYLDHVRRHQRHHQLREMEQRQRQQQQQQQQPPHKSNSRCRSNSTSSHRRSTSKKLSPSLSRATAASRMRRL